MALTKINNNTLSAVTTLPAAIATGKVLQVVQASISTSVSSTSASFVSAGFTATLSSLSSTSSKVLCTLAGGRTSYNDNNVNPNRLSVTLFSSINGGTAADIMPNAPFCNFDLKNGTPGYTWSHSGCFLYSPSTTSSVAITPYFRVPNDDGTPFFNHATTSGESSAIPATVTITLMEIAG